MSTVAKVMSCLTSAQWTPITLKRRCRTTESEPRISATRRVIPRLKALIRPAIYSKLQGNWSTQSQDKAPFLHSCPNVKPLS